MNKYILYILIWLLLVNSPLLYAQILPPPQPATPVPVDGGVGILLAACAGFVMAKRKRRDKSEL